MEYAISQVRETEFSKDLSGIMGLDVVLGETIPTRPLESLDLEKN